MIKRCFDVGVASVGLVLAAPILVLTSVVIKLYDFGPVFYSGERIGLNGRAFRMWKFRSMIVDADRVGGSSTPADDSRLTPVGGWLRRYKLDELPQLWNVLTGDMSLVGPRPQVPWAVARYTQEERVVLSVRPGITDPASIAFSNEGEILKGHPNPDDAYFELIHPSKMRLSIEYVRNRTAFGDLKIIAATLGALLRQKRPYSTTDRSPSI